MLGANVWRRIIGVDKATVIESVEVTEEEDAVVVCVHTRRATKRRCGRCGERAPGYGTCQPLRGRLSLLHNPTGNLRTPW